MLDTQSHQWKTIVGVVAFLASVATIIALIVQLESRDRDATTVKEQVASQDAQIALQKTQIALSAEHNRILAEQGTVTARQAQAQQQLYATPAVNDEFAPTATALARANVNAQATQQALEGQRQRIEATQTAVAKVPQIASEISRFRVSAATERNRTGITVALGDLISVEYLDGQWTGEQGKQPLHRGCGFEWNDPIPSHSYPIPVEAGAGAALIAYIADEPYKVGCNLVTFEAKTGGDLSLGMNDCSGCFWDNQGDIFVSIRVLRR